MNREEHEEVEIVEQPGASGHGS